MTMSITTIAGIISGLTVIIGFAIRIYKFFRGIEEKYEEMNETLRINTIHVLKIAVLDENLPLVDRIHAGEQYIAMGGNGTIKRLYQHLLDEYEQQL